MNLLPKGDLARSQAGLSPVDHLAMQQASARQFLLQCDLDDMKYIFAYDAIVLLQAYLSSNGDWGHRRSNWKCGDRRAALRKENGAASRSGGAKAM